MRLHDLSLLGRLGVTLLLGVLALGMWASFKHMEHHHGAKDLQEGLSKEDMLGSYHSISKPAPLLAALDRGHPEELIPADAQVLREWLDSPRERIAEEYDNYDRWEFPPFEVLEMSCLSCHADTVAAADGGDVALDGWENVQEHLYALEINPPAVEILYMSSHTHALSLGTMALVLVLLLAATRFARRGAGLAIALMGAALLADMGGWFLAREREFFAYVVVGSGCAFALGVVLSCLLVFLELWLPDSRGDER